jgi:predicted DNA-binding antitoxin AbrB/MazE fold protein
MSTTLDAVYENGSLQLAHALPLPEHSRVVVTIQTPDDAERLQWLQASEAGWRETWDNSADDVFNELLKK